MIGMMTKWEYLRQLQFFSIWTRGKEYMIEAQNGFHGTNRPYRTHPPNVSQKRNLICILAPPFSLNHLPFSRYFAFLLYQTCQHTTQKQLPFGQNLFCYLLACMVYTHHAHVHLKKDVFQKHLLPTKSALGNFDYFGICVQK